jgi:hypothetical protein
MLLLLEKVLFELRTNRLVISTYSVLSACVYIVPITTLLTSMYGKKPYNFVPRRRSLSIILSHRQRQIPRTLHLPLHNINGRLIDMTSSFKFKFNQGNGMLDCFERIHGQKLRVRTFDSAHVASFLEVLYQNNDGK